MHLMQYSDKLTQQPFLFVLPFQTFRRLAEYLTIYNIPKQIAWLQQKLLIFGD